jgi:hypothetical protein
VGAVLGEANCIRGLGDVARVEGDRTAAQARYNEALALYQRIAEAYSIGETRRRLAQVTEGDERAGHAAAPRAAWLSIGRADLVAEFLDPLG